MAKYKRPAFQLLVFTNGESRSRPSPTAAPRLPDPGSPGVDLTGLVEAIADGSIATSDPEAYESMPDRVFLPPDGA